MSLDVSGCYTVFCILGKHLRSNEIGLVIKYLEKNLWEYPVSESSVAGDSNSYNKWEDFLRSNWKSPWKSPTMLEWALDEDANGDDDDETGSIRMGFGDTDIYVTVDFTDQPAVLRYMREKNMNIPSSLDIVPNPENDEDEQANQTENKRAKLTI